MRNRSVCIHQTNLLSPYLLRCRLTQRTHFLNSHPVFFIRVSMTTMPQHSLNQSDHVHHQLNTAAWDRSLLANSPQAPISQILNPLFGLCHQPIICHSKTSLEPTGRPVCGSVLWSLMCKMHLSACPVYWSSSTVNPWPAEELRLFFTLLFAHWFLFFWIRFPFRWRSDYIISLCFTSFYSCWFPLNLHLLFSYL